MARFKFFGYNTSPSLGCGTIVAFQTILLYLGVFIHIWTVLSALEQGGILSAIASLILPIFAEIYWLFAYWGISGTIFNLYSITVLIYLIVIFTCILIIFFSIKRNIRSLKTNIVSGFSFENVTKNDENSKDSNIYVLDKDDYRYEPERESDTKKE